MHVNFHSPIHSFPRFVITIYVVFINARAFFPLNLYSAVQMNEFQIFSFMQLLRVRLFRPKVGSHYNSSPRQS